jgi:NAD(P)-dependent dehydrogenase (short-subunit alcohol dehydrogenase family)
VEVTAATTDRRVCLLTGSRGRLGAEFCKRYAASYDIIGVHRSDHVAPFATQQYEIFDPLDPGGRAALPENAHPVFEIKADLRDRREHDRIVELALARFGRIDLFVSTAVHWDSGHMLLNERVLDEAADQFFMNTIVPVQLSVLIAKAFWKNRPDENRSRNRNIVHLSSVSSLKVFSNTDQSVYSASKAALNAFTAHLAHEFEHIGVRANALAPSQFYKRVPVERVAEMVKELDEGTMNGKIAQLDDKGVKLLTFALRP